MIWGYHYFRKPPTGQQVLFAQRTPNHPTRHVSCWSGLVNTSKIHSKGAAGEILPKLSKLLPWEFSCCGWNHVVGCFPTEKSVGLFFIPPKKCHPYFFEKIGDLLFHYYKLHKNHHPFWLGVVFPLIFGETPMCWDAFGQYSACVRRPRRNIWKPYSKLETKSKLRHS